MKITVLNGSPKGDLSVTLQYINFIQKKYPEIEICVHHVAQKIKAIEKNEAKFQEIMADVASSDAVWWSTPIYVFLVPSQYIRFIELISERGAGDSFKNKYTAVFCTSIHFYDHTGINFMHASCDDLEMKFVDFFSSDMYDLTQDESQERLLSFAGQFFSTVEKCDPVPRVFQPLKRREFSYLPGPSGKPIDLQGKRVLLLADRQEEGSNLEEMIQRFLGSFSSTVERINLSDVGIKGGCLGCVQCAFDNECVYQDKDGYIEFYRQKVTTADIFVCASDLTGRYLSSAWKQFYDRRFFNTHIPTMAGKQIAFIISGPLSQIANLREVLNASVEMDHANLAGIVTDEFGDSAAVDSLLDRLAEKSVGLSEKGFVKPETFLGVSGRKVFRDAVWGRMRFPFLADHKFYTENGYYDFPQEDTEALEFSLEMIEAVKDPETREEIRKSLKSSMVESLKHIVETR